MNYRYLYSMMFWGGGSRFLYTDTVMMLMPVQMTMGGWWYIS